MSEQATTEMTTAPDPTAGMELLTIAHLRGMLHLSDRAILRMSADGEFPRPIIPQARRRRWSKRQVEAWLRRRESAQCSP